MRRIGVLSNLSADDPVGQARLSAFRQALEQLGWIEGRNVRIDTRWYGGDDGRLPGEATELLALDPDVILAATTPVVTALRRVNRTVPIVFNGLIDPVGSGLVESLAHPGGNATGFVSFEYNLAAKWLQLLLEIAPGTTRVGVLRDPAIAAGIGQFAAIQTVAPISIELSVINMRDAVEIERAVTAFAGSANSGLIVTANQFGANHPEMVASLAAKLKLPAVYPYRYFPDAGGLLSYGPDMVDQFSRAGGYVDRILKGTKPADLPVQAPTRYEFVINLKAAKALGLTLPPTMLVRADEVIE